MSSALSKLAKVQAERRVFYMDLATQCRELAAQLLAQCDGMWEVLISLLYSTYVILR